MRSRHRRGSMAGFTLMEIAFTVVLLGILTRVAMTKWVPPAMLTLESQAEAVADVVRRAQNLASVRGLRTGVRLSSSTTAQGSTEWTVAVCTSAVQLCSADASVTVGQGISLSNTLPVHFNSLGMPVDAAGAPPSPVVSPNIVLSFTDNNTTFTRTVTVTALTGRVAVTSP